jgi:hypothetical protein
MRKVLAFICMFLLVSTAVNAQYVTKSTGPVVLQASVTKTASFAGTDRLGFQEYTSLIVTLNVTVAERDTGNETYDFYITTGDGVSAWDMVHFSQVATSGAKTYTALIQGNSRPVSTTTAGPGVEAILTGTMKTDTAGSDQGIKTLTAGMVRNAPWGDRIGYQLVVAGTVVTGITYSITVTPKR